MLREKRTAFTERRYKGCGDVAAAPHFSRPSLEFRCRVLYRKIQTSVFALSVCFFRLQILKVSTSALGSLRQ